MRNNNREIIRLLAKREYDGKKGRNRILTGAAALAALMVFGVFSLAAGKIQADYLLYIRNSGTAASTVLEAPSAEQYRQIQSLSYIRQVGKETVFGAAQAFSCAVLDRPAWEEMQKPAYTDIQGNYPRELYEVMLPVRALQEMGIDSPQVGMKIPLAMELGEGKVIQEEFQLSGYYTEYVDPAMSLPYGYFSEKYLQEGLPGKERQKEQASVLEKGSAGAKQPGSVEKKHFPTEGSEILIEIFPEAAVTLLIQQDTGIAGETVEEWLYRDISMTDDSQQFFGGSAMTLEAVTELAGGYDMAWFMAAVIFLFAWLLIYNILFISMQQDIRRFGLLQTLGTTTKQIRRIVLLQVSRCACKGCFVGALAGIFLVVVLMPGVLSNMYLQGLGNASAMIAFRPWILAASVFFGAGVTYLSSLAAMLRLSGMSAVESAKYMEKASVRPFHRAWKIHRPMQTPAAALSGKMQALQDATCLFRRLWPGEICSGFGDGPALPLFLWLLGFAFHWGRW
jgi:putative ABC transport system permease protein